MAADSSRKPLMARRSSLKPLMTSDSYELWSSGPVQLHYIPKSSDKEKKHANIAKVAIQYLSGWTPLFCSTAQCFTRVICQVEVPLFVPDTVDLFVKGKEIEIFVPANSTIRAEAGADIKEKTLRAVEIPQEDIAVMYAADLSKFNERIEVVITDGMKVFCGGATKVTVASDSAVVIHKFQNK